MLAYSLYVRLCDLGQCRHLLSLWGTLENMKKPVLRVTKWLRDIPIEGRCTLCPETVFQATSLPHLRKKPNTARNFNENSTVTLPKRTESQLRSARTSFLI
jgi:hypothetical protein